MKSAGLKETLVLPPLVGQLGRFLHLESAERGGALCSFSCSSVCSVFCVLWAQARSLPMSRSRI